MRFNFRLESLLNLKRHEEEEKREKLVGIRREMEREERRIESLENRLLKLEDEFKSRMRDGMSGSEIKDFLAMKRALEYEIESAKMRLEEIKRMEKEALEEFLEKRRERKALEKLKERKWREFLEEIDSRERKILDEVAERKFWWGSNS